MKMMTMSDLHLEFHKDGGKSFLTDINLNEIDVLALAGDIGIVSKGHLPVFLKLIFTQYPDIQIVYVPGNHEFYYSNPQDTYVGLGLLEEQFPNFHVLRDQPIEICGQRFLGNTLWVPKIKPELELALNDFRLIKHIRPWYYEEHQRAVAFLEHTIRKDDIVLTHMIPSMELVSPQWVGDALNCYFASDSISREVLELPKAWIFGHTHDSIYKKLGNCQFICNPYGYHGCEYNYNFSNNNLFNVIPGHITKDSHHL